MITVVTASDVSAATVVEVTSPPARALMSAGPGVYV